jgi:hypothetical protein
MSKPNLLGYSTAVGFNRNRKVREAREDLLIAIPRKIDFAELAGPLFQTVMAYAAENQIDGNFEAYSNVRIQEIFTMNHWLVTVDEAAAIWKIFNDRGLLDKNKIRSWAKFNKHLSDYEKVRRQNKQNQALSVQARLKKKKDEVNGTAETPNGVAEYGIDTQSEPAKKSKQISWEGTSYTPTEFDRVMADLQKKIQGKKKSLGSKGFTEGDEGDDHNWHNATRAKPDRTIYAIVESLNDLEKQYASAVTCQNKSRGLAEVQKPKVHTMGTATAKPRTAAKREVAEIRSALAEIENPSVRSVYYDRNDALKPEWQKERDKLNEELEAATNF